MLRPQLMCGAPRPADDHGNRQLSARHVPDFSRVVDDLIQRQDAEVKRHELDDRTQPGHGRTDGQPGEPRFRNRGVQNPLRAELFHEPPADLEGPLVITLFLADQEDAVVPPHLLAHGLVQRFAV